MKPAAIKNGLQLANATASLLRTAALTIGPPLLRLAGDDKEGKSFAGLIDEKILKLPRPEREPIEARATAGNPFQRPINYVCSGCGSDNVRVEAHAEWDVREQAWVCSAVYQKGAECAECGAETRIEARPVNGFFR